MTNLEGEDTHVSEDLTVVEHEQENALDWLDKTHPDKIPESFVGPSAFCSRVLD